MPLLGARPAASGPGEAPRIPLVSVSLSGRDVTVSAQLSPGLPGEVRRRLSSGLATTATWEVRLFVSRRGWWDGLRDERLFEVSATYRPVSGDYAVERRMDGRLLSTDVVPTREEAERALSSLPGLPCFRLGPALAGRPLAVKARCVHGSAMRLGLFPVRVATRWRRSPPFVFAEPEGAP